MYQYSIFIHLYCSTSLSCNNQSCNIHKVCLIDTKVSLRPIQIQLNISSLLSNNIREFKSLISITASIICMLFPIITTSCYCCIFVIEIHFSIIVYCNCFILNSASKVMLYPYLIQCNIIGPTNIELITLI